MPAYMKDVTKSRLKEVIICLDLFDRDCPGMFCAAVLKFIVKAITTSLVYNMNGIHVKMFRYSGWLSIHSFSLKVQYTRLFSLDRGNKMKYHIISRSR